MKLRANLLSQSGMSTTTEDGNGTHRGAPRDDWGALRAAYGRGDIVDQAGPHLVQPAHGRCARIATTNDREETMRYTKAAVAAVLSCVLLSVPALAQNNAVKIGVLDDMSGPYAENTGPGDVAAVKFAIADFGGSVLEIGRAHV